MLDLLPVIVFAMLGGGLVTIGILSFLIVLDADS
jgi:hypothetical protein